jgi:hypothetical protein
MRPGPRIYGMEQNFRLQPGPETRPNLKGLLNFPTKPAFVCASKISQQSQTLFCPSALHRCRGGDLDTSPEGMMMEHEWGERMVGSPKNLVSGKWAVPRPA